MKHDPFGNITDWGAVLSMIEEFAATDSLSEYQHGLIRILRYKGNWRLREEVLKRAGDIKSPTPELILQVIELLADDNIYYDARVLAGEALVQLLSRNKADISNEIGYKITTTVEKLRSTPQPTYFDKILSRLYAV